MFAMTPFPEFAERLARPLAGVIAGVLAVALFAAVLIEPSATPTTATRAGIPVPGADPVRRAGTMTPGPEPATAGVATEVAPTNPSVVPTDDPVAAPATAAPLGVSAVPAAGVYRYQVQSTSDGRTEVLEESREVVARTGDRTAGVIELSVRVEGETQVSLIDWSADGALVRSTRIDSDAGDSRDCTWSPPFPEVGRLAAGSTWTLDSTCTTQVGGIDTTFTLTGTGRVVGPATVDFDGQAVRVWQIERDRTTAIDASLGAEQLSQRAREQGTLLFDPVRGLVMRSDVTVTLDGEQTGVTQRTSVLQPG